MNEEEFIESSQFDKVKLGNSEYSLSYVLNKVFDRDVDFLNGCGELKELKACIREIGIGKGFCSRVFRVFLQFNGGPNKTFIVKHSTNERWVDLNEDVDEATYRSTKELIARMHVRECEAYRLLNEMQNLPVPRSYYVEETNESMDGIIVIKDVSRGNRLLDVFESATNAQCFDFAKQVANFQAQFEFLPNKNQWIQRLSADSIQTSKEMNDLWAGLIRNGLLIDNEEVRAHVQEFIKHDLQKLNQFVLHDFSGALVNTVCRGEVWAGNVFMKLDENGNTFGKIGALIDWQTIMIGNPLYDIACFMALCVNANQRISIERQVVDFYYNKLCSLYSKRGAKPKFTKEQAHEFYNVALLHCAGHQTMIFSTQALQFQHSTNPKEMEKHKELFDRLASLLLNAKEVFKQYPI